MVTHGDIFDTITTNMPVGDAGRYRAYLPVVAEQDLEQESGKAW